MNIDSWRDKSQVIVTSHLLEVEAQAILLGDDIDLIAALTEISRDKYPFQAKKGHAYKAWLAAIRWTKARLDDGWNTRQFTITYWRSWDLKDRRSPVTENQLNLFGD